MTQRPIVPLVLAVALFGAIIYIMRLNAEVTNLRQGTLDDKIHVLRRADEAVGTHGETADEHAVVRTHDPGSPAGGTKKVRPTQRPLACCRPR